MIRPLQNLAVGIVALVVLPAGAAATPEAMDAYEARHLLVRTGFGAAPDEISSMIGLSYVEGVDRILSELSETPSHPMPEWVQAWDYPADEIWDLGDRVGSYFLAMRQLEMNELLHWWLVEMAATPSPLTERMTLFWHDHFATSYQASENSQWMGRQNQMFRTHATGNFRDLLISVLRDPAMLDYLSNTENTHHAPNENLAREFFELFTLGHGRGYSEGDVKEAARALTGHTLRQDGAPVYTVSAQDHDPGEKTILEKTGPFMAADLVDVTLSDHRFGPYIVEKLWKAFVSPVPDEAEIAGLAELWRQSKWEMKPLLRALLLSDAFWEPANRGTIIKSPLEVVVGTVRTLGLSHQVLIEQEYALEEMGQLPFSPPNVAGWTSGTAWINDATVVARSEWLTEALTMEFEDPKPAIVAPSANKRLPMSLSLGDIRVGAVFARDAENLDGSDRIGGLITLYDVGFADHSWRSLTIWFEAPAEDEMPFISLFIGDCRPECFANSPMKGEDPDWIELDFHPELASELRNGSTEDLAFVATISAHLPEMVAATESQTLWTERGTVNADDEPGFDELFEAGQAIKVISTAMFDTAPGALILDPSAHGLMGLDGQHNPTAIDESFDELVEVASERQFHIAAGHSRPPAFSDHAAWMEALPFEGPDSSRVEAALLAVPLPPEGRRMELQMSNPEALVRRVLLSPYYQLK